LRGLETSRERVEALAGSAKLVGDIQGGQDGYAEAVDGVAVSSNGAHLGVDDLGEAFDVLGIGAAKMVDLVVDVYSDRLGDGLTFGGLCRGFEGLVHLFS
jgi:hypothetical protein